MAINNDAIVSKPRNFLDYEGFLGFLFCYEQSLTGRFIRLMSQKPDVIIARQIYGCAGTCICMGYSRWLYVCGL